MLRQAQQQADSWLRKLESDDTWLDALLQYGHAWDHVSDACLVDTINRVCDEHRPHAGMFSSEDAMRNAARDIIRDNLKSIAVAKRRDGRSLLRLHGPQVDVAEYACYFQMRPNATGFFRPNAVTAVIDLNPTDDNLQFGVISVYPDVLNENDLTPDHRDFIMAIRASKWYHAIPASKPMGRAACEAQCSPYIDANIQWLPEFDSVRVNGRHIALNSGVSDDAVANAIIDRARDLVAMAGGERVPPTHIATSPKPCDAIRGMPYDAIARLGRVAHAAHNGQLTIGDQDNAIIGHVSHTQAPDDGPQL